MHLLDLFRLLLVLERFWLKEWLRNSLLFDDSLAQNSDFRGEFFVLKLYQISLPLCRDQFEFLLVDLSLVLVMFVDLAVDIEVFCGFLHPLVNFLNVRSALDSLLNDSVVVSELRDLSLSLFEHLLK